tara:strand:+ start:5702 stop:6802 length:1101 start_codon:yes stop_codon:yes gene_type:complete
MAKNIIKSYNSIVAVQDATVAFSTANQSLLLHKITQGLEYSIGYERQQSKQIGSQDLSTNDIFQQPDVNLNITYIPEPSFSNEVHGRFIDSKPVGGPFKNFFDPSDVNDSTNFYVLITKNAEDSFLNKLQFSTLQNFNGDEAIAFGNCFPNSYGLSYSIGSLPTVSTSYICSNAVFDKLIRTSMEMPAINMTGGNNDNVGNTLFTFGLDLSSQVLEKAPPVVNPDNTDSDVTLQNLEVGGQIISGKHLVQSVDMNVSMPRVSSYGLGNEYAFNRKRQFPANGTFSVSSLVSGLETGAMTGVLNSDKSYQFDLKLDASGKQMIYRIEDAKLDSYNYSINVNGTMSYDANFSFQVTQSRGLKVSGTSY